MKKNELEFYPDLDENEPEDHTAEDAEYEWKRDKEQGVERVESNKEG